jgi:hypothetical protein
VRANLIVIYPKQRISLSLSPHTEFGVSTGLKKKKKKGRKQGKRKRKENQVGRKKCY